MNYYEKYLKYKKKYLDLLSQNKEILLGGSNNSLINEIYLLCNTINDKFKVNLNEHTDEKYKINGNKVAIINDKEIDKLIEKYNNDLFSKDVNLYSFSCVNSLINIYKIRKMLVINYDNLIPFICSICNGNNVEYFDKDTKYEKLKEISIKNDLVESLKEENKYDCVFISNSEINNLNLLNNLKEGGYLFSINKEQNIKNYNDNNSSFINEGILLNSYEDSNDRNLIYVYRKFNKKGIINKDIYDRELVIKEVEFEKKKFNIIREDKLIGGTKQRIGVDFIKNIKEKHLFYRGPVNGYAQVALAYSSLLLNKKFHIILNKQDGNKKYIITLLAMIFGAIVHEVNKLLIKDPVKRKEIEYKRLDSIVDKYKPLGGSYLVPLGLKAEHTPDLYLNTKIKDLSKLPIKRIWLVASSGLIYDSLYKLLPNTEFNIVFVSVKNYHLIKERTNYYEAPEYFRAETKTPPPYPSEISYDAKMWQFIKQFGKEGDYVFNVAGLNKY